MLRQEGENFFGRRDYDRPRWIGSTLRNIKIIHVTIMNVIVCVL